MPARKPTAMQPRMLDAGNGSRSSVKDPSGCQTTTASHVLEDEEMLAPQVDTGVKSSPVPVVPRLGGDVSVLHEHLFRVPEIDWSREVPVLPVAPSTLPDLEAKITGRLAKLDRLPYEAIGKRCEDGADLAGSGS